MNQARGKSGVIAPCVHVGAVRLRDREFIKRTPRLHRLEVPVAPQNELRPRRTWTRIRSADARGPLIVIALFILSAASSYEAPCYVWKLELQVLRYDISVPLEPDGRTDGQRGDARRQVRVLPGAAAFNYSKAHRFSGYS